MLRLDDADKAALGTIAIRALAVLFAVISSALVLAVAVRLFFVVSGL